MADPKIVTRGGKRAPVTPLSLAVLQIIADARAQLDAEEAAKPRTRGGKRRFTMVTTPRDTDLRP